MKLLELNETVRQWKNDKVLDVIRRKLTAGQTINIHNAVYTPPKSLLTGPFCWKDLEKLNFASQQRSSDRTEERWYYHGPNNSKIRVLTTVSALKDGKVTHSTSEQILEPGQSTDWVQVYYS